jgi:hypothetical protein
MTFQEKVDYISTRKMLRLERWRNDEAKHYRGGIEWYENKFEFICEQPTLEQCLDMIIEYMDYGSKGIHRTEKEHGKKFHNYGFNNGLFIG